MEHYILDEINICLIAVPVSISISQFPHPTYTYCENKHIIEE